MSVTERQTFLLAALDYCRACTEGDVETRLDNSATAYGRLMRAWRALPPEDRAMNPPEAAAPADDGDETKPWWQRGPYE